MDNREKLLEEREKLKIEYAQQLKLWKDSKERLSELLTKSNDTPNSAKATFKLTKEFSAEYTKADKECTEVNNKRLEILSRISKMNAKLQP